MPAQPRLQDSSVGCWTVGGIWVLTSLTAIALIGDTPYLGLTVAILAGVAVGLASFLHFQTEQATPSPSAENAEAPNVDRDTLHWLEGTTQESLTTDSWSPPIPTGPESTSRPGAVGGRAESETPNRI